MFNLLEQHQDAKQDASTANTRPVSMNPLHVSWGACPYRGMDLEDYRMDVSMCIPNCIG